MHDVSATAATHRRILVVDDNETNRQVAARIFLHLGCRLSFAVDGHAAIEAVQRQQFDLVLMDCHMPNLDGIAATKAIRAWESSQSRPATAIIAVSADVAQENRALCAAAGMNGFIAKPFNLAAAKRLLASNNGASTAPAAPASLALPAELFAHAQFMEIQQLMGARLCDLLTKFGIDAEQQLMRMRHAAQSQDAETLRHSAHKLKGSSASIGACALSARCAELERKALARQLDEVMSLIDAVAACHAQTSAAIATYLASLNVPRTTADVKAT